MSDMESTGTTTTDSPVSSGFLSSILTSFNFFGSTSTSSSRSSSSTASPLCSPEETAPRVEDKVVQMKSVINELNSKLQIKDDSSLLASESTATPLPPLVPQPSTLNFNLKKRTIKIALVGDGGVGKTTLIHRHKTGQFLTSYVPTQEDNLDTEIKFYTNLGEITLQIIDTGSHYKVVDEQLIDCDAVIIMFDLTSNCTFFSLKSWKDRVTKVLGDKIPIVVCGNKNDCVLSNASLKIGMQAKKFGDYYCEISAKTNYNFEKPFLHIIRQVIEDDTIHFIIAPTFFLPKENIHPERLVVWNSQNSSLNITADTDDEEDNEEGFGSLYEENILALQKVSESPYLSNLDRALLKNIIEREKKMCKIHYNQ
jgi:GTP-binding nuclear protein Ran